jgi:hypothetical protein
MIFHFSASADTALYSNQSSIHILEWSIFMRHTKNQTPTRLGSRLLTGIVLAGTLIVVLVVVGSWQRPALPTPASHFVELSPKNQTDSARRTVVIAPGGAALPNFSRTGNLLMTSLVDGQLPSQAVQAVVRTDANCQPDQDGVSHCLNELAVGSETIMVRHHHKMSEVPCLTPGEAVTILSLEHYKQL